MKMRDFAILAFIVVLGLATSAQDITLTNKAITFTNLEGRVYKDVELVRGNLFGLIWRDDSGSGGQISYTNLAPEFLERIGIPQDRIANAKMRADKKAQDDARYRAAAAAQIQAAQIEGKKAEAQYQSREAAKQLMAQQKADLKAINELSAQIEAAEANLTHQEAVAHEATLSSPDQSYYVVGGSLIREQIGISKKRLAKMQADYTTKYGSAP